MYGVVDGVFKVVPICVEGSSVGVEGEKSVLEARHVTYNSVCVCFRIKQYRSSSTFLSCRSEVSVYQYNVVVTKSRNNLCVCYIKYVVCEEKV